MKIDLNGGGWVRATRNGERGLLLSSFAAVALDVSVREGQREPMEGWMSANYGCMEPAPALVYSADIRLPLRVLTVLWPAEDIHENPDVQVLRDAKGHPSGIRTQSETVIFNDDEMYVRHSRNH
jgi:hypothetical protein